MSRLARHVERIELAPDLCRARCLPEPLLAALQQADGLLLPAGACACDSSGHGGADAVAAPAVAHIATLVRERCPGVAVEYDVNLREESRRTHFQTKLYALARLRRVAATARVAALVEFHSRYKYLLMCYCPSRVRALGRIVAQACAAGFTVALADYRAGFGSALAQPPGRGTQVDALLHVFGYFSARLPPASRTRLLHMIEGFRTGVTPRDTLIAALRHSLAGFELPYIRTQALFEPFPPSLNDGAGG